MATGTVNSHGTPLNKRSGPGTSYPVVGSVADGTTVTIVCQTDGTPEAGDSGPWTASSPAPATPSADTDRSIRFPGSSR